MKTLRDIGEDALIARLVRLVPRHEAAEAGPGDDCAVIDPGTGRLQLLKTDALVENVHFLPGAPARAVGWKAAARVVSDFAAMGGRPEYFLVTIALRKDTPVDWIEGVYRGMGDCLEKFGGLLAGGETSSIPDGSAAVISIAATGSAARDEVVLRSTAKAGDVIFVTGRLGGSLSGKHLDFTPRVEEAEWLARHFRPTAMMDLSDGLAKDLPRLAEASGCGFTLDESGIPASPGCTVRQALSDGEDFELLFTVGADRADALLRRWQEHFPELILSAIGHMTAPEDGEALEGGWDHFNSLGNQASQS